MRFLVVGLGSMGRRRIRCLSHLGEKKVAGFDINASRVTDAARLGIEVFTDFDIAVKRFHPDVMLICTPPQLHFEYAWRAVSLGLSVFIEASVLDGERLTVLDDLADQKGVFCFPSCTMKYFRGPVAVKQIINSGDLGKILAVNYQTGQYLPDWHPWEPPQDFYVSKRETGGCREIVPFELTWLNDIFGAPTPIFCYKSKISNFDFDIDDIYQIVLKYPKGELVNIVIEVLSRPFASRMLYVIGSDGQLMFDGEKSIVRYATIDDPRWHELDVSESNNFQDSINPEGPYVRETSDFITAVATRNASVFPNSLSKDAEILTTLYELERLAERRGAAM